MPDTKGEGEEEAKQGIFVARAKAKKVHIIKIFSGAANRTGCFPDSGSLTFPAFCRKLAGCELTRVH